MPLVKAKQPHLIRSCQKDEFYQNSLRNSANEAVQTLTGSRRWLQWRKEVELLSDLTYYALTTLSGYQTLGEEYVNIIQVDPTGRRIPARWRRLALVLFHTVLPYTLDRLLVCVEHELEVEEQDSRDVQPEPSLRWSPMFYVKQWIQSSMRRLNDQQRKHLKPLVFTLHQGISVVHRVHLALFYISGLYYHLAKRTTGISYLRFQSLRRDDSAVHRSYRMLGFVSLLQLVLTLTLQFKSLRQRQRTRQEWTQHRNLPSSPQTSRSSSSRASRCILCLEDRRHSTLTPCGHLFCWECITEWCNTKTECPLCREKFQPHRLVYLRGYT